MRNYQDALRAFCSYVSTPEYGWDTLCDKFFGTHPSQVCFEWNTARHVQDLSPIRESGPSPAASCRTCSIARTTRSPASRHRTARDGCPPSGTSVMLKVAYG